MNNLKELLINTFEYIEDCNSQGKDRHINAINRAVLASDIQITKMTERQLLEFDINVLLSMITYDSVSSERHCINVEVSNISVFDDIAEIVDIYGQGSHQPTGKGVNGFQVDMDVDVSIDGYTKSYHVVFQNLERTDGIMAYSGIEMTTSSRYGCDADESNDLIDFLDESCDISELLIEELESVSSQLCNEWFELNSKD